jgi:hypothetical protein
MFFKRRMTMGILSGNPKNEPMHYGEVYNIWVYAQSGKLAHAGYQTLLNHIGDDDLKLFLEDMINTMSEEIEEVETLLKENEVGLAPTPPDRPYAKLENIPVGARFNDAEIAMGLAADIAAGLVTCSGIMGQSIREDIALLFGKYHTTKAAYGARLLRINKDKGWIVPPTLHLKIHKKEE